MEPTNLTIEILKSIRDEGRKTNERLDQTNQRLDQTNQRLDETRESLVESIRDLRDELSQRIVESEMRTATAIVDLSGAVKEMVSVLRTSSDLRPRVEKCEQEIERLKGRLPDA